jgi:diguanylate cyclase
MAGTGAVRVASEGDSARRLFDNIGEFLVAQRLDAAPANYAFAYHLLSDPESPLAKAVAALTDGGVRLTQRDVDELGCDLKPAANTANNATSAEAVEKAQLLVAQTQFQVEGFQDVVTAMRAETEGFGRDLAATTKEMIAAGSSGAEIARMTAAMLERVTQAETRLAKAKQETDELRSKLEEARDNARRDPLTGLPNRRAFEEAFNAQIETDATISVAVCDVDHFKSVNDRFGHVVGDRVLKALAESLSDACKGHLVARYGGEEFVVLFSGVAPEKARAILEKARGAVHAKRYRVRESDEPVGAITFSAGLSGWKEGEVLGTVFHRADQLCYAAKHAGRDCLRWD